MKKELVDRVIAETVEEDIPDAYKPIIDMIGLENVIKLSQYFMGDKIYLPKADRLLSPARNRIIRREYNGKNTKELAQDYDITTNQILQIVRDLDPEQLRFDFLEK